MDDSCCTFEALYGYVEEELDKSIKKLNNSYVTDAGRSVEDFLKGKMQAWVEAKYYLDCLNHPI